MLPQMQLLIDKIRRSKGTQESNSAHHKSKTAMTAEKQNTMHVLEFIHTLYTQQ